MKPLMISIAVLGLLFYSFLLVDCAQVRTDQKAPDFVASTMDGERFALKEYGTARRQ